MKSVSKYIFNINGFSIKIIITDKLWKQNCYVVTHVSTGEQILIDPGGNFNLIHENIKNNGDGFLKYILLTHAHFDHIGALSEIKNIYDVPCYLNDNDHRLMRQSSFYTLKFGAKSFKTPKEIIRFKDTPELIFGNKNIDIIFTPGHTLGGVCYILDGFIFTGDTLLYESVGRADLPGSDINQLKKSVNNILYHNNGSSIIFSGHGTHWTIAEARLWWKNKKNIMPQHNMFIK